jgi:hypothetical protein
MPHKDKEQAKIWRRKWYANLPQKRKQRMLDVANLRATRIRRWLDAYKLKVGCVDCPYNKHPAALHFDHIKGKKKLNVSFAKSIKQAKKEIKKCVVRCANCHSERTFKNHVTTN